MIAWGWWKHILLLYGGISFCDSENFACISAFRFVVNIWVKKLNVKLSFKYLRIVITYSTFGIKKVHQRVWWTFFIPNVEYVITIRRYLLNRCSSSSSLLCNLDNDHVSLRFKIWRKTALTSIIMPNCRSFRMFTVIRLIQQIRSVAQA